MPRHLEPRGTSARARHLAHPRAFRLLSGAAALAILGVCAWLWGLPGSLALWNQADEVTSMTVTSGTLNATIAVGGSPAASGTSAAIPSGQFAGMLPGERRGITLTVQNIASTPFVVMGSVDAATDADQDASYGLSAGACAATPGAGTTLTTAPAPIGSALTQGQYAPYCLTVTLSPTLPSAAQKTIVVPAFTVRLDAQQERP